MDQIVEVQWKRVLTYMEEHGSITSAEAFDKIGVSRLAEIVRVIKKQGFIIDSIPEKGKNRYGQEVHYKRYFIGGKING